MKNVRLTLTAGISLVLTIAVACSGPQATTTGTYRGSISDLPAPARNALMFVSTGAAHDVADVIDSACNHASDIGTDHFAGTIQIKPSPSHPDASDITWTLPCYQGPSYDPSNLPNPLVLRLWISNDGQSFHLLNGGSDGLALAMMIRLGIAGDNPSNDSP